VRDAISRLRAEGLGLKAIAKTLAPSTGWSSRDLYRLGLDLDRPHTTGD